MKLLEIILLLLMLKRKEYKEIDFAYRFSDCIYPFTGVSFQYNDNDTEHRKCF